MKVLLLFLALWTSSSMFAKDVEKLSIIEPIPMRSYLLSKNQTLHFAEAFNETRGKVYILYSSPKPYTDKVDVTNVIILNLENSILSYSEEKFPVGFVSKSPNAEKSLDSICSLEFEKGCKIEIAKNGQAVLKVNKDFYTQTIPPLKLPKKDLSRIKINRDVPQCNPPHCCGEPDGCEIVRDTWGPVSFKDSCDSHDRCYYTVGTSADGCNEQFKQDLLDDCKDGTKICVGGTCIRDPIREGLCVTWATAQVLGVIIAQPFLHPKAQDRQKDYEAKNSCSSIPKDFPEESCDSAAVDGGYCPSAVKGTQCKIIQCPGGLEVEYIYTCTGTSWKLGPGGGSTGKACR